MKIRTDFVTNSSSSISAYIVIDNPVLLEILQKYKEMGAFPEIRQNQFSIGYGDESYHGRYSGTPREADHAITTRTPAFFYFPLDEDPPVIGCPKSLDEVLSAIIDAMSTIIQHGDWNNLNWNSDYDLFEQLRDELHQKGSEIRDGFISIIWEFEHEPEEMFSGTVTAQYFYYDPINGEKFDYERYEGEDYIRRSGI